MRKTRMLAAMTAIAALAVAAPAAQAHTERKEAHISCGEIDGYFASFPQGVQTVTQHTTIDGVVQAPINASGTVGPDGLLNVSNGFRNADAGAHVVSVYWSWTADGGSQGQTITATVTNCPPPEDLDPIRNQINVLNNEINFLQQQITINTTDIKTLACHSNRVYKFLTRTSVAGVAVTGVDRVLVRGSERYASVMQVSRNGKTRWQVTADYRDGLVPRGQLRSVTTFLHLANGHSVRTVQLLRLCLADDGNLNDPSTQDRARR